MRAGTLLRWNALKPIFNSEIKDDSAVIDIGGFDGFISHNLKLLFPNLGIVVVDLDNSGLEIAKNYELDTLHASATDLPIDDNSIDMVLCLDLIEHLENDVKLIQEIFRILRKGGKVILTTPMEKGVLFPFLNREKNIDLNKKWGHMRMGYKLKQIIRLFQENGLIILKTSRYFNIFSRLAYLFISFPIIPNVVKWFVFKLVIKFEPFIKLKAAEHIIVGVKL